MTANPLAERVWSSDDGEFVLTFRSEGDLAGGLAVETTIRHGSSSRYMTLQVQAAAVNFQWSDGSVFNGWLRFQPSMHVDGATVLGVLCDVRYGTTGEPIRSFTGLMVTLPDPGSSPPSLGQRPTSAGR